jgi:hypothetical protein
LPPEIDYLGEGPSDAAIARRLIEHCGVAPGNSYSRPPYGKNDLDRRLRGLNAGAPYGNPVLVLRDADGACPAVLATSLLAARSHRLLLRICVPTADAWLVADRAGYAAACGVPQALLPDAPEACGDVKQIILGLAASRPSSSLGRFFQAKRRVATPDWSSLGAWHAHFARDRWDPAAAASRAPSLRRAMERIAALA